MLLPAVIPKPVSIQPGSGAFVVHATTLVSVAPSTPTTRRIARMLGQPLGDERYVLFDLDAPRVDTDATRAAVSSRTSDDALLLPDETRARFTIRLPADLALPASGPLTVSMDPHRLYFFDPDTGAALPGGDPEPPAAGGS